MGWVMLWQLCMILGGGGLSELDRTAAGAGGFATRSGAGMTIVGAIGWSKGGEC